MADDEQLRAMAAHRGLKLVKSRRRKAGTGDFGRYGLADAKTGQECFGFGDSGLTATADEIQEYLRSGGASSWKRSLKEAGATPRRAKAPRPRADNDAAHEPEPAPEPEPPTPPPPPPRAEPNIRKYAPRDEARLAEMLDLPRGGIAAYARARNALLVAERGDAIGCVAWQILHSLGGRSGRLTALFVAEDERRQGIGSALLAAAERELRKSGCDSIEAISAIEIGSAHSFFRRAGYSQASYRFVKAAEQGSE